MFDEMIYSVLNENGVQDKKPYKVYVLMPRGYKLLGKIDAHSDKQATFLLLKRGNYDHYREMGYTIKSIIDKDELAKRELEAKEKEEEIQNAWWQD